MSEKGRSNITNSPKHGNNNEALTNTHTRTHSNKKHISKLCMKSISGSAKRTELNVKDSGRSAHDRNN